MSETIPVPIWLIVVMAALLLAREIAAAIRDKAHVELWKLYWKAQYGADNDGGTA